ncbi:MAG TPA: FMN-binding glutamate synthase family protein [Kofleriaceae bacterium]|nr:FMN-binding glutamate synthase family protein [Kofleriaceae bacterium]
MWIWVLAAFVGLLVVVVLYDITQRKHAILRNFPVIGHFRYWLEKLGPELRQYIVTGNDEERPFSRDQRRWVYASAKRENNYFGFGTDNDLEQASNHPIIKHAAFPVPDPAVGSPAYDPSHAIPCAKILGGHRDRRAKFRPASVINTSAMSFGSLSGAAVEAINRGVKIAGCLQNTGEGGISRHHLHGGDLIWQIGTAYFGCRDEHGRFSLERLVDQVQQHPVRALEIKLSQGAKPGMGGLLPAAKITEEIATIRGIPRGHDCHSPPGHSAFHDVDSMLDFVELLADRTGLPVGIKSAIGEIEFWQTLAAQMATTHRGVDFITVDGGEGGTGAAPLVYTDNVALPFKIGFARVYRELCAAGVQDQVVLIGSGKLGFPAPAMLAFGLGCDMINVAREAMLAVGCIQAQRCHTGHCPTGVATQSKWLARGLSPTLKSARVANYIMNLRKELLQLSRSCGVVHPALVGLGHLEIIDGRFGATAAAEVFGYEPGWGLPSAAVREEIVRLMGGAADDGDEVLLSAAQ